MIFRLLAVLLYAALGILVLSFIFSNREPILLNLFPLERTIELPAYAALIALFILGLLIGLLNNLSLWLSYRRRLVLAKRSIAQLEQEVAITSKSIAP